MFQIRLKGLREDLGISQSEFANRIGVAQSTVGGWESGKREPNFEMVMRLADFFGVSTDYLLGKDNVKFSEASEDHKKIPSIFIDPEAARDYLRSHDVMAANGMNLDRLDDETVLSFANDLMKIFGALSTKLKE